MKMRSFIDRLLGKKRKTLVDGEVRLYDNSLFTDLQDIMKRIHTYNLEINEKDGKINVNDSEKMNFLLMYHQADQQRRNSTWFIILTIVNILVLITSFFIKSSCH